MKQVSGYSPLLRAFTSLMALWIFVLLIFAPINNNDLARENLGSKFTVADASFILKGEVPSGKQSFPKSSFLDFSSDNSDMLLLLVSSDILEYKAVFLSLFIANISFYYISSKGP